MPSPSDQPRAVAVIPARFASTRFPGKPLVNRTGKFLIQHVVERVQKSKLVTRCIVATDDSRIAEAVKSFGGNVAMTRYDHPNGTSRIAEVVERLDPRESQFIVNVQGDEPEIEPEIIDQVILGLARDPEAPMATIASDFAPDEDPTNPNIVKLVVGVNHRALYFSRSIIPFDRDKVGHKPLKHPGLYAYRRDFLLKYVTLAPSPLEQIEQLEQLRALEHGYPIAVVRAQTRHHGIDTPEQYEEFVRRLATPR